MKLYLDADIFLALIKEEDRHKKPAINFLRNNTNKLLTSNLTCLEIWFYLYRNNLKNIVLDSIRAVNAIAEIIYFSKEDLESAIVLATQFKLSPADAIHAVLALKFDYIVSSDTSFDHVKGLKRIDFLKN